MERIEANLVVVSRVRFCIPFRRCIYTIYLLLSYVTFFMTKPLRTYGSRFPRTRFNCRADNYRDDPDVGVMTGHARRSL